MHSRGRWTSSSDSDWTILSLTFILRDATRREIQTEACKPYNATSSSILSRSARFAHPLGIEGLECWPCIYSSNVFSGIEQETAKLGISTTSVILKLAATLANM